MTCVVGCVAGDAVHMASDSRVCDGSEIIATTAPKMERYKHLLIGWAGPVCDWQAFLHWYAENQRKLERVSLLLLAQEFGDWLRTRQQGKDTPFNADFLIGYQGGLYHLDSDLSVVEVSSGVAAIGSGSSWALATMEALPATWTPKRRLTAALKAAQRHDNGVGPPFHYRSLH